MTNGNAGAVPDLRAAAESHYLDALKLNPISSATLLNLSQLEVSLNKKAEAQNFLLLGLRLGDARYLFAFAENLGDLQSDKDAALRYYLMAAASVHDGKYANSLHLKIFNGLMAMADADSAKTAQTAGYLWGVLAHGELDRAIDAAATALERDAFRGDAGLEMMTIIAAALARKNYDAVAFAQSDAFRRLKTLRASEAVAPRVHTLFLLYQGDVSDAAALDVWKTAADRERPPDRPTSTQAIQQVAHGLGFAAQRQRDLAGAEHYYNLALSINPADPDPGTLLDLAGIYYSQKRISDIEQLLVRYEPGILHNKGEAADRIDFVRLYDYHRALGAIYTWLKRYDSAAPQFESALENIESENEVRRAGGMSIIEVDPNLRLQFAESLTALNQHDKAAEQRLAAADAFASTSNLPGLRNAVARIDPAAVSDPQQRQRLERYLDASVVLDPAAKLEDAIGVKSTLALLSTVTDPAARVKAQESLRKLGITAVRVDGLRGTFQLDESLFTFQLPGVEKSLE